MVLVMEVVLKRVLLAVMAYIRLINIRYLLKDLAYYK